MTNYETENPKLFISHASSDAEFANAVKQEIEKVFENGVEVFCTSSPGTIQVGVDWLREIEGKLTDTQAIIVIVTPVSIERPLFEALVSQFGFGKKSLFKSSNITKRIPKYKDVKIKDIDLNEKRIYSGPYAGYSDDELMELIDTNLFLPDDQNFLNYTILFEGREDLIHNGKLLHFKELDARLQLPPGTSKRLIVSVANRYGLVPQYERENVIRFKTRN